LAKAVALASEGKLDDAIKELEEGAKRGENPVEVQTGLGHLRFEQKNWAEAARAYGKVAELEPKHRTAHYNLGLCLERQGKFEEADKQFAEAASIDPGRWQAQLSRGLCLLQLGKPGAALESLEAGLKAQPKEGPAGRSGRPVSQAAGGESELR
jgi:tetratricopeptide (TPR) repeat protein